MIRWLAFLAFAAGLVAGIAFPRVAEGHVTSNFLAVELTPPTLPSGSSPLLLCGWHGICYPPTTDPVKYGLDWADGGYTSPWYFRGFFWVSNTTSAAFKMFPLFVSGGLEVCDKMTVWIAEKHSGQLMAIPTYTHVNITNSVAFEFTGGPLPLYRSRQIGVTINENWAPCADGSHVHEAHVDHTVTTARHTNYYPTEAGCTGSCLTHQNNLRSKWTRGWAWQEGVSSH